MIAGLNISQLGELAVLLVIVGGITGFLAGMFGIGGGAVLVPVLYECFRVAGVPPRSPDAFVHRHLAGDHHADRGAFLPRALQARER